MMLIREHEMAKCVLTRGHRHLEDRLLDDVNVIGELQSVNHGAFDI
jgi:hypothetical protein